MFLSCACEQIFSPIWSTRFVFNFQAIGARLEEMLLNDKRNIPDIVSMMSDESKQKELLLDDEEEDFLDEGKALEL